MHEVLEVSTTGVPNRNNNLNNLSGISQARGEAMSICAKLVTFNKDGRKEGVLLPLSEVSVMVWPILTYSPSASSQCLSTSSHRQKCGNMVQAQFFRIYWTVPHFVGSSYVVSDAVVSSVHCKLYASVAPHLSYNSRATADQNFQSSNKQWRDHCVMPSQRNASIYKF